MIHGRRPARSLLTVGLLLFALAPIHCAAHLGRVWWTDRDERAAPAAGFTDDVSRMNATAVARVVRVSSDQAAARSQIAAELERARVEHLSVSIAGARHSMGGHTIAAGGVVLDMDDLAGMTLAPDRRTLHVGAGALWSEVLPWLNARGLSVAVMQSNDSFTVGGSLSVNCHGWQASRPPIASTVRSFVLILADGTVRRCSRTENEELFRLALGGYGLVGAIVQAEIDVVPNVLYQRSRWSMSAAEFPAALAEHVHRRSDVGMAYGRLAVDPTHFLEEAALVAYARVPGTEGGTAALTFPQWPGLTRAVFRGQVGSDYGKRLRRLLELHLEPRITPSRSWRNQLLSEPVEVYVGRAAGSADVIHEYFVPAAGFAGFVADLRRILRRPGIDLLNVTLRDVRRDDDTRLRYATTDMIALVLLFDQPRTAFAEEAMRDVTRAAIDAALGVGGRYYLPYRLHATDEQFHAAYPQAESFFAAKRRYDPGLLWQNTFYRRYSGSPPRPAD